MSDLTIQTRTNRETGTTISVQRVSAGSDQRPFYTCTCEHGAVRHCHTLAEARRRAAHPSWWCEGCAEHARVDLLYTLWTEFSVHELDESGPRFGGVPVGELDLLQLRSTLNAVRSQRERGLR